MLNDCLLAKRKTSRIDRVEILRAIIHHYIGLSSKVVNTMGKFSPKEGWGLNFT
jgi:hypothetical protein